MITWNASMEVGIQKVDAQHRELVDQINKLHSAMMERKGREVLSSTVGFLKDYALSHFSTEEGLMRVYKYPGFDAHKKLHEEFKTDFVKLAKELSDSPESSLLTIEVENRLSNWLVNHIKRVDKETMGWLASQGAK